MNIKKIINSLKSEAIEELIWSIIDKFESNSNDDEDEEFLIEDAKLFWIVLSNICFVYSKEEIVGSALVIHSLLKVFWLEYDKIFRICSSSTLELVKIFSSSDENNKDFIEYLKKSLPYAVTLFQIISPNESGSLFFFCVVSNVCSALGLCQAKELMQDEFPCLISEEDFVTTYHQLLALFKHFKLDYETFLPIESFNEELDKEKNKLIEDNKELDSRAVSIICDHLKITF